MMNMHGYIWGGCIQQQSVEQMRAADRSSESMILCPPHSSTSSPVAMVFISSTSLPPALFFPPSLPLPFFLCSTSLLFLFLIHGLLDWLKLIITFSYIYTTICRIKTCSTNMKKNSPETFVPPIPLVPSLRVPLFFSLVLDASYSNGHTHKN